MNLLTDSIFTTETSEDTVQLSLPALLAALGKDRVISLAGIQRHQEDSFHIFLSYLAAKVLASEGVSDSIQNESFWRNGLRNITGRDDDVPWQLVVEDVTQPAFMQPPLVNKNDQLKLKPSAATADELDLLPTSKNHDLKVSRAYQARVENWVYSLISLQTMSGFFGRGNYGIARMNGGFASRVCVELQVNHTPGGRWQRAVKVLLNIRDSLLQGREGYKSDGIALLWLSPWSGEGSLPLSALDPFFIEIARVIRLVEIDGKINALAKPASVARISAKQQKGVVGDPWIPINNSKNDYTALTVSATGLTPDLLRKIIFNDGDGFGAATMQIPLPEETGKPCWLYVSVLVRGQGTTDGFHSIRLPIPDKSKQIIFGSAGQNKSAGKASKQWIDDARAMQNRVLKPALFSLLEGGPEQINFDKREVAAWINQGIKYYSQAWEADYFEKLWQYIESDDQAQLRIKWLISLQQKAEATLEQAMQRMPQRQGRQYKAKTSANKIFFGSLKKNFEELEGVPKCRANP